MTGTSIFESDSFNRRMVEKLVEQRDRILGGRSDGDAASVWQQIALELSQDWELDCGDLRWQDLSRYFRRSLVFKLSHRKWTTDQGLIDRLQYPYLRKVYVITIQFYERYCAEKRTDNSNEIEDNKLFIKYTMDGRFDPDVVSAFKRRSRKGMRIYVNINVADPIYNLPEDVKKLLLQMEHHRKERPHRNIPSDVMRENSPILLDGVPVAIDNESLSGERNFSPRDLLEKESFSVNTQEYDDIIKESLERELPPIPKRRRLGSFNPGCVEVWLETCEMLSPAKTSVVASPQDDPLHLSTRSSFSEPQLRPAANREISQVCVTVELVRSQPPTLIMASQPEAATQDSIRIKQEASIDASSEIPTLLDAGLDPLLSSVFTDSDDEEEGNESGPGRVASDNLPAQDIVSLATVANQHEVCQSEASVTSRTTSERLFVDRNSAVTNQPETSTQEPIQIKQEHKAEDLKNIWQTSQAGHDPYLDSILTDSDDTEEGNVPSNSNEISCKIVNEVISVSAPSKVRSNPVVAELLEPNRSDNPELNKSTQNQSEIVSNHPPMLLFSCPNATLGTTVKQESEIKIIEETSPADAVHDPYLNGIFTDSDDDDDDEEEDNAPSFKSVISNKPTNDGAASDNRSCPTSEETRNPKPDKRVQDQSKVPESQSTPLVIASQGETQESISKNISEATHEPHISRIFTDSDNEDEEETNQNPSKIIKNLNTTSADNNCSSSSAISSRQTENENLVRGTTTPSKTQLTPSVAKDSNRSNATSSTQNHRHTVEEQIPSISVSISSTTTTASRCFGVELLGMPTLNSSLEPAPLHCTVKQRLPPVATVVELSTDASQPRNTEVDLNETEAVASPMNAPAKTTSQTKNVLLTKATQTEMVSASPDLRTDRFYVNIPLGSQSPNLHVYMGDLRSNRSRSPPIQPSSRTEPVCQSLEDPVGHSYRSTDSSRLVIAWSPSSSSNSSNIARASKAETPPTVTSPTGPQFREEQYDCIRPAIESRLRLQAVLRSLWPELFARSGSFCDFLHLISVLALNIFPRLQPIADHGAMALLGMVAPLACRLAYGSFESIEGEQTGACPATIKKGVSNDRGAADNGIEGDRCIPKIVKEIEGNSGSTSTDEAPMIVLSDDDEQENLPVRTKRQYRVHQQGPSGTG